MRVSGCNNLIYLPLACMDIFYFMDNFIDAIYLLEHLFSLIWSNYYNCNNSNVFINLNDL